MRTVNVIPLSNTNDVTHDNAVKNVVPKVGHPYLARLSVSGKIIGVVT
jgi:hypothetical protein